MKRSFVMAWRNIWRNKRRTLITIASIFFAVFFAVIMRSFQLGTYDHMIHQAIESFSGYIQVQNKEFFYNPTLDHSFEYNDDLISSVDQVDNIKIAVPRVESFALASTGTQSKGVLVTGIDTKKEKTLSDPENRLVKFRFTPKIVESILNETDLPKKQRELLKANENQSYSSFSRISLDLDLNKDLEKTILPVIKEKASFSGNYLEPNDNGILISDRLAKYLKANVGDTVVLIGSGYHGMSAANIFPVRGIVKLLSPELDNKLVYMSLSTAQQFFSLGNNITSLNINLHDTDDMYETQEDIKEAINSDEFTVKNWEEFNPTLKQQIEGDSVGGVIFIGILYFIVLFGIIGTVLMMIAERKRELGVMVAIGMSKIKLSFVLIIEMLFLGFIGTLSGLVVSAPIVIIGNRNPIKMSGELAKMYEDMGFDPVMPLAWFDQYFLWQALVIMIMVLIACYLPLRRVRRMKVVNALRA
ncbi:MAG: FtsX-like permease family protein [Bacteroidetes bacterium]|nr:FtsX-like permease family protein [Bacteroidota bacterium]